MAVPNTTTFSLQDVVDEVNPTTDDLVDCFADAITSAFDSDYSGSKNSLLNFRNYNSVSTISLSSASPFPGVLVGNTSTDNQNITYNWEYVGQSGDIDATVSYDGVTRSPGFVTSPNTTVSMSSLSDGYVEQPFTISGGNATTVEFKFQLLSATVDTVPNFPDQEFTVYVQVNY